jgi:hypothetical protein
MTTDSELMMGLLQELALLKQSDDPHRSGVSDANHAEHELREKRRREICEQIKALGGPIG